MRRKQSDNKGTNSYHAVWPRFVELSHLLDSNPLTIDYIMIVIGLKPKTQTALMIFPTDPSLMSLILYLNRVIYLKLLREPLGSSGHPRSAERT